MKISTQIRVWYVKTGASSFPNRNLRFCSIFKHDTLVFPDYQIWSSTHGLAPWCLSLPFPCFKHSWIFKSSSLASSLILFWNCQNWILQIPKPNGPVFPDLPNLVINRVISSQSVSYVCSLKYWDIIWRGELFLLNPYLVFAALNLGTSLDMQRELVAVTANSNTLVKKIDCCRVSHDFIFSLTVKGKPWYRLSFYRPGDHKLSTIFIPITR
jgi:hypothetical protein